MPVIANTSVVANFAVVHQIDLLRARFGTVFLSDHVFEEIQNGLTQGYAFYEHLQEILVPFSPSGWLYLTVLQSPEEFRLYGELLHTLHSGEASSLAIAFHRQWTFLTDDKAARERGKTMKISISGTLGVLSSLVQRNQLPILDADRVLERMVACGHWTGGQLFEHGQPVGRVSYNGRVWDVYERCMSDPFEHNMNGGNL